MQQFFVDNALANAASDICRLTSRLEKAVDKAKAPELRIQILGPAMVSDRGREWEKFGLDWICSLPVHDKIEHFQAARREITWLKLETSNLEKETSSRRATLKAGRAVKERSYTYGQR